jgi:hypothetical protein
VLGVFEKQDAWAPASETPMQTLSRQRVVDVVAVVGVKRAAQIERRRGAPSGLKGETGRSQFVRDLFRRRPPLSSRNVETL